LKHSKYILYINFTVLQMNQRTIEDCENSSIREYRKRKKWRRKKNTINKFSQRFSSSGRR
jgi:hypothetical protein